MDALPAALRGHFGLSGWEVFNSQGSNEVLLQDAVRPLALLLPQSEILFRRIQIPMVSRLQLPNLMRFEAIRHIPLPIDQVRWDFRFIERDFAASKITVELAIIRVKALEAATGAALAAGRNPEAVMLQTATGFWLSRRLIARNWRDAFWNRRVQSKTLKIAIPIVLLFTVILAIQNWANKFAQNRSDAVVSVRALAEGIEPLRQQIANLNDQVAFIANAREQATGADIAEEVAKLLPDDAWLQELDIEPQDVRLVGTSYQATDLLKAFSVSSLFSNVQFEAPLTSTPVSGEDQFGLMMTRN